MLRGALSRAGLCSGEMCHATGDMRACGAREGIAGMYGADYSENGAGDSGDIESAASAAPMRDTIYKHHQKECSDLFSA